MIFLFPENMILPLRRKMKDDLSQKNTRKYDIFFKCSEKMVFSKRIALIYDLFCTLWKGDFFSRKRDIFSLDRKWERGDLSQEIHGKMTCSIWYVPRQLPKKWSYTAKIHLKVIDILDPHPRKSSSSSLYFHGDLYRGFHILLSNEKKQET